MTDLSVDSPLLGTSVIWCTICHFSFYVHFYVAILRANSKKEKKEEETEDH